MKHVLPALLLIAVVSMACGSGDSGSGDNAASDDSTMVISGELSYPQRIALRPGGTANVTLEDVSLADTESIVIAEQNIELGDQQVPIPFELTVPFDDLKARNRYSVRATITGPGDELRWTTDTANLVDPATGSTDLGQLRLIQVASE